MIFRVLFSTIGSMGQPVGAGYVLEFEGSGTYFVSFVKDLH